MSRAPPAAFKRWSRSSSGLIRSGRVVGSAPHGYLTTFSDGCFVATAALAATGPGGRHRRFRPGNRHPSNTMPWPFSRA